MFGRVTVVGCGLIGGSIVKGLRARGQASSLCAVDRPDVLAAARSFVDEVGVAGSNEARDLVARSDLVVLATPISAIVECATWVLDAIDARAVVTDTGSVKGAVLEAVAGHSRRGRFVAGHPMTGREVGGFEASSAGLFEGAQWFLVSAANAAASPSDADASNRATALAAALGAAVVTLSAEEHDRAMAFVSHAPQLVASAVYEAAASAGVIAQGGPGFRDVTRIAGGPIPVWGDIFRANGEAIAHALARIVEPLIALRDQFAAGGGSEPAVKLLEQAARARAAGRPATTGSGRQ
jgi:prephenate dehydrogenase